MRVLSDNDSAPLRAGGVIDTAVIDAFVVGVLKSAVDIIDQPVSSDIADGAIWETFGKLPSPLPSGRTTETAEGKIPEFLSALTLE